MLKMVGILRPRIIIDLILRLVGRIENRSIWKKIVNYKAQMLIKYIDSYDKDKLAPSLMAFAILLDKFREINKYYFPSEVFYKEFYKNATQIEAISSNCSELTKKAVELIEERKYRVKLLLINSFQERKI